jgi:hypothetical protein
VRLAGAPYYASAAAIAQPQPYYHPSVAGQPQPYNPAWTPQQQQQPFSPPLANYAANSQAMLSQIQHLREAGRPAQQAVGPCRPAGSD